MRLKHSFNFGISFLSLLFLQNVYPGFKPLFFSPYLCSRFYTSSFLSLLANCLLCGIICDIFSSLSFGIYIIGYCSSGIICYKMRFLFFEDKFFSLACLTSLFSIIFSLTSYLVFPLLNYKISGSFSLFIKDLLHAFYVDALFSLCIFTLPSTMLKIIFKFFHLIGRRS